VTTNESLQNTPGEQKDKLKNTEISRQKIYSYTCHIHVIYMYTRTYIMIDMHVTVRQGDRDMSDSLMDQQLHVHAPGPIDSITPKKARYPYTCRHACITENICTNCVNNPDMGIHSGNGVS
jgi:hypothetical protein